MKPYKTKFQLNLGKRDWRKGLSRKSSLRATVKTGPFLDRAGMQEGGRPVAVVDELHKRLEEQLVKCGRQRASGFSGHPRPDSGRGAMPGSGEKPLRHWAEQKRGMG